MQLKEKKERALDVFNKTNAYGATPAGQLLKIENFKIDRQTPQARISFFLSFLLSGLSFNMTHDASHALFPSFPPHCDPALTLQSFRNLAFRSFFCLFHPLFREAPVSFLIPHPSLLSRLLGLSEQIVGCRSVRQIEDLFHECVEGRGDEGNNRKTDQRWHVVGCLGRDPY